ncbi:MAG: metallophosphoesterase [Verrucomicrobia bacterium]|nr:metallophosphoesterase [Verrucomicrobiota bacterium]
MESNVGYDIVGDVHGHAGALFGLLDRLGYHRTGGIWRHPECRRAVFAGDLVQGGEDSLAVLATVREMVTDGAALAVLGNHEANLFHHYIVGDSGEPLREMTSRQLESHGPDLGVFGAAAPQAWADWLVWLRTLPLWLDLGGCRVVHACWHEPSMRHFPNGLLDDAALRASAPDGEIRDALEILLKGPTLRSLKGVGERPLRRNWWKPTRGIVELAGVDLTDISDDESLPLIGRDVDSFAYPSDAPPLFIGHYALAGDAASAILAPNIVCVDLDVKSGGPLTAYRWTPEEALGPGAFVRFP